MLLAQMPICKCFEYYQLTVSRLFIRQIRHKTKIALPAKETRKLIFKSFDFNISRLYQSVHEIIAGQPKKTNYAEMELNIINFT
jgi:hypothetical protein